MSPTVPVLRAAVEAALEPFGLDATPFRAGAYNAERRRVAPGREQLLQLPEDTPCFVVSSRPDLFERIAHFYGDDDQGRRLMSTENAAAVDGSLVSRFVHAASAAALAAARGLDGDGDALANAAARNIDEPMPEVASGLHIHAQTAGHVAGLDEHVDGAAVAAVLRERGELAGMVDELEATRDPLLWGADVRRVFGLNLHPRHGGWYAYRSVLFFAGVGGDAWAGVEPAQRVQVTTEAERVESVVEYNMRPELCRWRGTRAQYSPAGFAFFTEQNAQKRRMLVELAIRASQQ